MIVYKATNIVNGKIYIGATRKELSTRRNQHESLAKKACRRKLLFHHAINKYGIDSFRWEVIYTTIDERDMFDKESYFIRQFNSTDRTIGYNVSLGGFAPLLVGSDNGMFGKTHSDSVRKLLSNNLIGLTWEDRFGIEKSNLIKNKLANSHIGRKNTEEAITKMKESSYWKGNGSLILGENNPNFGKRWDDTKKAKVSGENNGMFGVRRFGSDNGMFGKTHSNENKIKTSKRCSGKGNPRYKNIDTVIDDIILDYANGLSMLKISEKYSVDKNKVRRELIMLGVHKPKLLKFDN